MIIINHYNDAEGTEFHVQSTWDQGDLFTTRCPWSALRNAAATARRHCDGVCLSPETAVRIAEMAEESID